MAGPATCLFRDLNGPCAGDAREHVIPECIGGTLVSEDVICDRCNHYFGDTLDRALGQHFEPIVTQIGLLMRARFRRRRVDTESTDGEFDLTRRPGGVVELDGIHRTRDQQGQLVELYAPPHQAHLLPEIVAREAPGAAFTFQDSPVTDVLREPLTAGRVAFTDELRRAAAKVLLEVVDEVARRDADPRFQRTTSLDPIRRFIRLGHGVRPEPSSPMVNLGAEMEAAFTTAGLDHADGRRAALNTDVAIFCDTAARRLFGLLTVAGTMPLAVLLAEGDDLGAESWSLLVRRPLLPGDGAHRWRDHAAIKWRDVKWALFAATTDEAILFARAQYRDAFSDALGRACVYVDRTDDVEITETLRVLRNARGSCGATVTHALRARFQQNDVPDAVWDEIADRVDTENIGQDAARLLAAFRRELETLLARFGLPRTIVSRGIDRGR